MSRIDEIAARLEAFRTIKRANDADDLGLPFQDIAFLLDEVKRLEGEMDLARGGCRYESDIAQQAIDDMDEARALALSLAEALSDAVPVLEHAERTHFDAVWRLTKAQAALSSPALLKLKGGV